MNILEIEKKVTVYYYVETDDTFPTYRRSESGNWEHLMGESWEPCYYPDDPMHDLESAFQKIWSVHTARVPVAIDDRTIRVVGFTDGSQGADGVYHIEHIDADHIRLTKKENL